MDGVMYPISLKIPDDNIYGDVTSFLESIAKNAEWNEADKKNYYYLNGKKSACVRTNSVRRTVELSNIVDWDVLENINKIIRNGKGVEWD